MNLDKQTGNNALTGIPYQEDKIAQKIFNNSVTDISGELIRFEEQKERHKWVNPDEICFVKSADHYVISLIKCGKEKKWMSRHCTLKELLVLLPPHNFIRLNKFYLLNRNYFSHINENEKILYFNDDFSIPVPHRISPYLRHLLKSPVREMHFTK